MYIIVVLTLFGYVCWSRLNIADNYFAVAMFMLESQFTVLLIYNVIVALATIFYRTTISLFYEEIKQNQSIVIEDIIQQLVQKLGYKVVQLLYFLSVIGGSNIGIHTFLSITVIFLMFTFHNIAVSRSKFLINAHSIQYIGLNYKLLANFLIMAFIDFQMISYTFIWLFGQQQEDASYVLFAYYCITISLTIIQPLICFIFHIYDIYTNSQIQNSDILLVKINFLLIIPRFIIQIILSIFIAQKFDLYLLMLLKMIQPIMQISSTTKNYNMMKKLIYKMKNLKQLNKEEIQKQYDKTCTVCFSEILTSAILLPCKHMFHKQCLRQWIIKNSNNYCPKCKNVFDFQNVNKIDKKNNKINRFQQFKKKTQQNNQKNDPLEFYKDPQQIKKSYSNGQIKKNYINNANDNIVNRKLSPVHKKLIKTKSDPHRVGSVPYGLPTQAIYRRTQEDIEQRRRVILANQKMIKFLRMPPNKQMLFIPEL